MYSLDNMEPLQFFPKWITLGHPSFVHLDLMKFPLFTYFMIWVSDLISLLKSQMSFLKTSVLIRPALREVFCLFVLLCFMQKLRTLRVTTVLWSLKDRKKTNQKKKKILYSFSCKSCSLPQGGDLLKGNPSVIQIGHREHFLD